MIVLLQNEMWDIWKQDFMDFKCKIEKKKQQNHRKKLNKKMTTK